MRSKKIDISKLLVIIFMCIIISIVLNERKKTNKEIIYDLNNITYSDSSIYVKDNLTKTTIDDAIHAYEIQNNNKCLDEKGNNLCSVYSFSINNTSVDTLKLKISIVPIENTYKNLHYIIYEINRDYTKKQILDSKKMNDKLNKEIDLFTTDLTALQEKRYQIVYFDLGKKEVIKENNSFGALIKISSNSDKEIVKTFGETCWILENDKLTQFTGMNKETGKIKKTCSNYIQKDNNNLYTVNIPSKLGGQKITTLGNNLFNAVNFENGMKLNKYTDIKKIDIEKGITTIEDGMLQTSNNIYIGTFFGIGGNVETELADAEKELTVNLPDTLTYIGARAFTASALKEITIPSNVTEIGEESFLKTSNLKQILFKDFNNSKLNTIGPGAFYQTGIESIKLPQKLKIIKHGAFENIKTLKKIDIPNSVETIERYAFFGSNLTYTKENPLLLPSNLKIIEESTFNNNPNLKFIKYNGENTETNWYDQNITTIIKE